MVFRQREKYQVLPQAMSRAILSVSFTPPPSQTSLSNSELVSGNPLSGFFSGSAARILLSFLFMLLPIIMAPSPEAVAQTTPRIEIVGEGRIPEGTDRIFTVNLESDISQDLEVSCETTNKSKYLKNTDYSIDLSNCPHTFTAEGGSNQSFTITVETEGDNLYEPNEQFTLEIKDRGTTVVTKTITIINDNNDSPPRVTIVASPEEVTEGGSVNLTLTLLDKDKVDYPITYTYFFPENRTATASEGGYGGTTMLDVEKITTLRTITIKDGETTATPASKQWMTQLTSRMKNWLST